MIEKSGGGEKLPVGRVVMFDKDYPALYANFIEAIHPLDNVDSRFLGYVFASAYHNRVNRKYYTHTIGIQNLNLTDYICERVMIPLLYEQTVIASYLDRYTIEIDELLADLQLQAEKLDRYKRELIAEVVTHGLDKTVPLKDSGVDWISKVPSHWNITKTKWMFEIVKRLYNREDRDVLSITQRGLKVKDIECNDGQLAESYIGYQIVNMKDFARKIIFYLQ